MKTVIVYLAIASVLILWTRVNADPTPTATPTATATPSYRVCGQSEGVNCATRNIQ